MGSPNRRYSEAGHIYDQLRWFDCPSDTKLSAYLVNQTIPVDEDLRIQILVYNRGSGNITCDIYMGIETTDLKQCFTGKIKDIPPGHVGWEIYLLSTYGRSIGEHNLGIFCEPHGRSYYAKGVGKAVFGVATGYWAGKKVGGLSAKFRIANNLACPRCGRNLQFKKGDQRNSPGWYCDNCRGYLEV